MYYTPDRNKDGFGLNETGIQFLKDNGATIVCVLDCGTSDYEGVRTLKEACGDVIILDHHLAGEQVPDAFAILNPILEEKVPEPFPCAAGVSFLFIQALIDQAQKVDLPQKPSPGWERWQLDIVSLATLSDMVPLHGINRQLVYHGLKVLRKSPRPGIRALCAKIKVRQNTITQDDLSFLVIPRINAASRMGDARLAFDLLTTDNTEKAQELVDLLTSLNNKRKTAVATMVREANVIASTKQSDRLVWAFGKRSWNPSLVGLVAQKLMETHGKTVFVWGGSEGGAVKGSCRSKRHNTFELMVQTKDLFIESGGHAQAGGFTLKDGEEVVLEDVLNKHSEFAYMKKEDGPHVDAVCAICNVPTIIRTCEAFAPFGMKNERVHVAIQNCFIRKECGLEKGKSMSVMCLKTERVPWAVLSFLRIRKNMKESDNKRLQVLPGFLKRIHFIILFEFA